MDSPDQQHKRFSISKQYSKYGVNFDGATIETTVTDNSDAATKWIEEIIALPGGNPMTVVGLHVEQRHLSNNIATLQVCIDNKCLILQLFHMDEIPEALEMFLLSPKYSFAVTDFFDYTSKMYTENGLRCNIIVDIVNNWRPKRRQWTTLKEIAKGICGIKMRMPSYVCMSNWEARVLSDAQVEYACIDAYACYRIGCKLIEEK